MQPPFFNKISLEYDPIPDPVRDDAGEIFVQPYQVAARLRTFKKPRGQVQGDIDPQLVTKFSDILAIPLSFVYNQVLNTLQWPALWKTETVTVIPKNSSPTS